MEDESGLTPSQQRYLATISLLESEQGRAGQSEIAEKIKVNRSSVTGALRTLAERAMILYEPYGSATLTPEGSQVASAILDRCMVIRDFLVRILDIEEQVAENAAFGMQHAVPGLVIERLSSELAVRKAGPNPHGAPAATVEDHGKTDEQS